MTYLINFLFEALLEHLISFIKYNSLNCTEVNVASLNMVEHTSARTDKEVNSVAKSARLIFNVDTTVDGQRLELVWMVLQFCQLILHLYSTIHLN